MPSANNEAWIAARFDGSMPKDMELGDNSFQGEFFNRPLQTDKKYRVFVRAYTDDNVSQFCLLIYLNDAICSKGV